MNNFLAPLGGAFLRVKHQLEGALIVATTYFAVVAIHSCLIHSYYSRPGHLRFHWEPGIEFAASAAIQVALGSALSCIFPSYAVVCWIFAECLSDLLLIAASTLL
jgi:hypothetical protein